MNNFLTRISKRAQKVLKSFGKKTDIPVSHLYKQIEISGGMGARIMELHPQILRFAPNEKINLSYLLKDSFFQAIKMGHTYVGTEHLLLSALSVNNYPDISTVSAEVERINSLPILLKQTKSTKTSILTTYGNDLTRKYIFYPREEFVERKEVNRILKVLMQKNDPNVLLLGDESMGKDGIIEALTRKISYLDIPAFFVGMYVIEFNFSGFLSGLPSSVDAFESALKSLASEVENLGRCIFVIKQLPNLLVAGMFRNFIETLNRAGVKFIIRTDNDSEDLYFGFTVIEIEEPEPAITKKILKLEADRLQSYFLLQIPDQVLEYVYSKAKNDIKDHEFPQKGILLLDKACAIASFEDTRVTKPLQNYMNRHVKLSLQIEDAFIKKDYDKALKITRDLRKIEKKVSSIPVIENYNDLKVLTKAHVDVALNDFKEVSEKEYKVGTKTLSDLEARLKKHLIGQDRAVEVVAKALIRAQMGLRPKNKPVGNFLFLGPTGVGKTELAKVLAHEAFSDTSLIRLDMSDFSEKHTVARLVGSPPGYVGYNEGGELTTKIRQNPQSVVLFDEAEKAHPEVLNILLQIMEEGQLSDMRGEVFDFSHAIIILTSNLGTDIIHKREIGYGGGNRNQKDLEDRVMQSVKSFIKPELINRFDEIITFRQLEKEDSQKILDLLLKEVHENLKSKGIKLTIPLTVKEYLLNKGFTKEFGARSLRRTVEKELLDKLAGYLLTESRGKGSKAVTLKAVIKNGEVIII